MYGDDINYQGNSGFLAGMVTGITVGIGLGFLLAPRTGAEIRQTLASSAADLRQAATDAYRQTSDRVKDMVDKGADAVAKGTDAVTRQARDVESKVERAAENAGAGSGPWSVGQGSV